MDNPRDRFKRISRALYALFDNDFIPDDLRGSVTESFSDGLSEVIELILDTEAQINAEAFNSLLTSVRDGNMESLDTLLSRIQSTLDSDESVIVFEEYYVQMIPVLLTAMPEAKRNEAEGLLDELGLSEELRGSVHSDYKNMIEEKKILSTGTR